MQLTPGDFKELNFGSLLAGTKIKGEFSVGSGRNIEFDIVGSASNWDGKKKITGLKFDFETIEDGVVLLRFDNRFSAVTSKAVSFTYQVEYPGLKPSMTDAQAVLTKLDMRLLKSLGAMKNVDELARATNVDVDVISRKLALLTRNGYITEGKELTEKGYLAVNDETIETPMVHREKEILTREIVRIPCRHCGSLVDQTLSKCPSCGAPLTR